MNEHLVDVVWKVWWLDILFYLKVAEFVRPYTQSAEVIKILLLSKWSLRKKIKRSGKKSTIHSYLHRGHLLNEYMVNHVCVLNVKHQKCMSGFLNCMPYVANIPANTTCSTNADLTLGQRRRRWSNIGSASVQHLVITGILCQILPA